MSTTPFQPLKETELTQISGGGQLPQVAGKEAAHGIGQLTIDRDLLNKLKLGTVAPQFLS